MSSTTDAIRNIALAGHGETGKTTLTEHLLAAAGTIARPETIASGKTVSDYTEEEIDRKISIHASLSYAMWGGNKINILDTPGASDFVGEVIASFRAAETAVLLVDGRAGVQIETIKLWRRLDRMNKPRIIFINKLEKEHSDYGKVLADIREKFSATFVPVVIPTGSASDFSGVVDLITGKGYAVPAAGQKETAGEIPASMADAVEEARAVLIESAAEGDDSLMEKYFEEETLSTEEILKGIKTGLRECKLVPVLCGAAELNSGIVPFLDFINSAAPSPEGMTQPLKSDGEAQGAQITPNGSPSAFIFRTFIDQFSGKLSFVKVVTGTLTPDTEMFNSVKDGKERVTKIYMSVGKKLDDSTGLAAGDIGIVVKLPNAETNDTLCMADSIVTYSPLDLPQPVHTVAVSATSKKEEDKLNQFLHRASVEDLTFLLRYNGETRETTISGMGELHVNMILDRIRETQKIEMETHVPRVAYRETITKSSDAEYTHKKQTGGHGQYGKVVLQIKPLERGEKFKFSNAIKGGSISKGYIPGVEKGILEGMDEGMLAGYPIVDLEAIVIDGREHPVDSSEMSFKLASKGALKSAMQKAGPVLLEPVMKLKVYVNEDNMGDILSDMSSRRGRVLGQDSIGGGIQLIEAEVPQSELLRYSIDLRSMTSGTGSFEMEFDHYSPISGKIAEDVIAASQQAAQNEE